VAKQMSAILAERQMVLGEQNAAPADSDTKERRSEMLFTRIKKFFSL
jgi:hypothetical protein